MNNHLSIEQIKIHTRGVIIMFKTYILDNFQKMTKIISAHKASRNNQGN
jgi:hypothetical protein